MFDFSWTELALIAVVALVVIGPKDLPRVMRTVGIWVRKARSIAHEFQGHLDQMVREAELDDVRKQVDKATRFDFEEEFNKTIDPAGELRGALNDPVLSNPMADAPAPAPQPAPEAASEAASEPKLPASLEPAKPEAAPTASPAPAP